jgi:serine/threonine-protein phosphatase PP1 catalytic subunit
MDHRKRLDGLLADFEQHRGIDLKFSISDAQWLCQSVAPVFLLDPTLLKLDGPVRICGDIHGQLPDLLRSFDSGGLPPYVTWLFLGDYVDRGPKSVEVICLLFALKLRFPSHIYLLRGNHESADTTEIFGFAQECRTKLNGQAWLDFCEVFDTLPLAAIVASSIFCVHGGISPMLDKVGQIAQIARPAKIPPRGLITDLLWSDPSRQLANFGPNARGPTVSWGMNAVVSFLQRNQLRKIVRAHQVAMDGFDFPFFPNESVVTLFTASNYAPDTPNRAAFLVVQSDARCDFHVLPPLVGGVLCRPRSGSVGEIRARPPPPGQNSAKRAVQRARRGSTAYEPPPIPQSAPVKKRRASDFH